jgi:hypothetical protein
LIRKSHAVRGGGPWLVGAGAMFRVIYIIPAYLCVLVLGVLLYLAVIVSWFAILLTARDPFTNYKNHAIGWMLKYAALYLLIIEDY